MEMRGKVCAGKARPFCSKLVTVHGERKKERGYLARKDRSEELH
jgi:hypothetical protein